MGISLLQFSWRPRPRVFGQGQPNVDDTKALLELKRQATKADSAAAQESAVDKELELLRTRHENAMEAKALLSPFARCKDEWIRQQPEYQACFNVRIAWIIRRSESAALSRAVGTLG